MSDITLVLRTGMDLVEIQRLENLDPEIFKRFILRVYTPAERNASLSDESLAGRFAAKEAVAKALGCGIGLIGWQEIEILSLNSGQPKLFLYGGAQSLARLIGITAWSISISHTRTTAAAVAVGYGLSDNDDDT